MSFLLMITLTLLPSAEGKPAPLASPTSSGQGTLGAFATPQDLTRAIDEHLLVRWQQASVEPPIACDDATFIRRVSLDLIGRIPRVSEVRTFLDDPSPYKRQTLVKRLLQSAAHADHMATYWRRVWVPQTETRNFQNQTAPFESWLSFQLQAGTPYDRLVQKLLLVSATVDPRNGSDAKANVKSDAEARFAFTPDTFLVVNEHKPESLAANTTRAFLGLNLDCAQCHDHPFARWSRDQFWQTAAFFTRPDGKPAAGGAMMEGEAMMEMEAPDKEKKLDATPATVSGDSMMAAGSSARGPALEAPSPSAPKSLDLRDLAQETKSPYENLQLTIPETDRTVRATLLDGSPIPWPKTDEKGFDANAGRDVLVGWITAPGNPYFARNAVNRLWANYLGMGLVHPIDDLSGAIPPSHPELLSDLAAALVQHRFDLDFVIEAIVLSQAYQADSRYAAAAADETPLFDRMPIRGLTGEQLYASLRTASGLPAERNDLGTAKDSFLQFFLGPRQRDLFLTRFYVDQPAAAQRSIIQSLAMMNGDFISKLTDPEISPILIATAQSPFLTPVEKVETLYLATLTRMPTEEEVEALLGPGADRAQAAWAKSPAAMATLLSDLMWAILNSSEFNTNH